MILSPPPTLPVRRGPFFSWTFELCAAAVGALFSVGGGGGGGEVRGGPLKMLKDPRGKVSEYPRSQVCVET